MSDTIKDGGPAFPVLKELQSDMRGAACNTTFEATSTRGMSIRDWFAGQVLCGAISSDTEESYWSLACADKLAEKCYAFADAMLAERAKKR